MQTGVMFDPKELSERGYPTFGRYEGKAVILDAYFPRTDTFIVRYIGLTALEKGNNAFAIPRQSLLDF